MIILHTRILDPMSRTLKLVLGEKRASFHVVVANEFFNDENLNKIDPMGRTPILIDDMWGNGATIREAMAAIEYIEDIIPTPTIFPGGPLERAEIRSAIIEANNYFRPFLRRIVFEKLHKIVFKKGAPDTNILREIRDEIGDYLDGVSRQTILSGFVIGNKLSLADFVIACQLSVLDYLDLISWDKHKDAKTYYMGIKQRPSFAPILLENLAGFAPPPHYKTIDF